jgi:hypothetical protein
LSIDSAGVTVDFNTIIILINRNASPPILLSPDMAQFRAKRLDLGGFINPKIIRDHTKRKVFEQHEPER